MSHHLTAQLQAQGHRMTPQRAVILRILEQANVHLTPADIFQQASRSLPGLTEPTVYRTLNFLASQGLALVAHTGSGQFVYEAAGRNHHHLICRACGVSLEVDHAALQPLYRQLEAQTGFQIDSIHITFFGYCPACQKLLPG